MKKHLHKIAWVEPGSIAEELGLSASKVSFMFEKVKKWYTTIDSVNSN